MRYPLHHPETLRLFEQLNQRAQQADAREPLRLRPLEIIPFRSNGQTFYAVRDSTGISPQAITLTTAGIKILDLLDGSRSLEQIAARTAETIPLPNAAEQARQLVHALGEALFLFDTAYRTAVINLVADFARTPERAPVTMGSSYPDDAAAARVQLLGYLDGDGGVAPTRAAGAMRGLIAPHIDYQRGHATYAAAYRALRGLTGVRRFIILGTAHNPSFRRFAATRKNFRTALGTATTDHDFVDRLVRRYPFPLFEDEFLHRGEHSIELEIPFLQVLFGAEVAIVPILCGSLHDLLEQHVDPLSDSEIRAFVGALRAAIAESEGDSILIAASDLSHMGPHFGDRFVMDDTRLAQLQRDDQVLLDRIVAGDAYGFADTLSASRNATRVCGVTPIYTLLQVLGATTAVHLLGYEQCTDRERFTTVTIPAAAFTN